MRSDTTILAYHFWTDDGFEESFEKIAHAFVETWKMCGLLKSVVVVNKIQPCVSRFANEHPNLEIQVEPRLIPGQMFTMSEDCNSRLYFRFSTDYVLIIQNDGWPVRSGLDEFVGRWDFIGASLVRNRWYIRLYTRVFDLHLLNGGFSLRSRRCCELAAYWWNTKYHVMGDCHDSIEDVFYTQFLYKKERSYRREMRFADVANAYLFSYEFLAPGKIRHCPFGFHQIRSLRELERQQIVR